MPSRIPFETVYFCGNCEEEITGMPAGSRIHSGRPLCLRCTHIGLEEGWAQSQEQCCTDKLVYPAQSKQGIMVIAFFASVVGLVIWMALTMLRR